MKNFALAWIVLLSVNYSLIAQQANTIEVEGHSEIKIKPDQANIAIQVQHKAMKASDASQGLNRKTKEITELIKKSKLGKHDLTTDNYQVNINRIYRKNTMTDSGYIASQTINIKIYDLENDMVKAVDALGKAQDIQFSMNYLLSDMLRQNVRNNLLKMALSDAREKANTIVEAMDLKELTVSKIEYKTQQDFGYPMYRAMAEYSMDAGQKTMPILIPEEQKVSDRVVVTFQFKNQ